MTINSSNSSKPIRLSPTTLNLFDECPRCFQKHMRGERRPRSPFPSLCGGMDRALKASADEYRLRGTLPPEIAAHHAGALHPDQNLVDQWRNWRGGLRWRDELSGAELSGAVDDVIVHMADGETVYAPLDFKTRGAPPRPGVPRYYQNPMNLYGLLLEENQLPSSGKGCLVYYWPKVCVAGEKVLFGFHHEVQTVVLDLDAGRDLLRRAASALQGSIQMPSADCSFCNWEAKLTAVAA